MSRKLKIEKVGTTTIVTTYDPKNPGVPNVTNYNRAVDVTFDTRNDLVVVSSKSDTKTLTFNIDDLEDNFEATNLQELAQVFAERTFFAYPLGGSSSDITPPKDVRIFSFQFDNISDDIPGITIDEQFILDNGLLVTETELLNGKTLSFSNTAKNGFILKTKTENQYEIHDVLGSDITTSAFDRYYYAADELEIYVSKNYVAAGSSIHYEFVKR